MSHLCYKVRILAHDWNIFYLPKGEFVKKCGTNALAVADGDAREIYVTPKFLNQEVIAHELFHAYVAEHSAAVMSLDADQMEELGAEITGKYAEKLLEQSSEIIAAYKIIKTSRRKNFKKSS